MCSCLQARYGAGWLAVCIYLAYALAGSVQGMIDLAQAGNIIGIAWAVVAGFSFLFVVMRLRQAMSHNELIEQSSFVWSLGAVCVSLYAMQQGWYLRGDALLWHASRAFWWFWLAENGLSLFLQLRNLAPRHVPNPELTNSPARYVWRRLRVRQTLDVEGVNIDAGDLARVLAHHLGQNTQRLPYGEPSIGHSGAVPQIVHVRDQDGRLIEIELPPQRDPMPRLPR
jgi:hypothetical protein